MRLITPLLFLLLFSGCWLIPEDQSEELSSTKDYIDNLNEPAEATADQLYNIHRDFDLLKEKFIIRKWNDSTVYLHKHWFERETGGYPIHLTIAVRHMDPQPYVVYCMAKNNDYQIYHVDVFVNNIPISTSERQGKFTDTLEWNAFQGINTTKIVSLIASDTSAKVQTQAYYNSECIGIGHSTENDKAAIMDCQALLNLMSLAEQYGVEL